MSAKGSETDLSAARTYVRLVPLPDELENLSPTNVIGRNHELATAISTEPRSRMLPISPVGGSRARQLHEHPRFLRRTEMLRKTLVALAAPAYSPFG